MHLLLLSHFMWCVLLMTGLKKKKLSVIIGLFHVTDFVSAGLSNHCTNCYIDVNTLLVYTEYKCRSRIAMRIKAFIFVVNVAQTLVKWDLFVVLIFIYSTYKITRQNKDTWQNAQNKFKCVNSEWFGPCSQVSPLIFFVASVAVFRRIITISTFCKSR